MTDAQVQKTVKQLDDSLGKKAVDDQLKAHDLTRADLSDLAHRILLFGAVQTAVASDATSEADLRKQYEDNLASYTTVQVDHILVKTKAEADDVYAQVTAPGCTEQDFLDLAKEVSIDPSAKQNSGKPGFGRRLHVRAGVRGGRDRAGARRDLEARQDAVRLARDPHGEEGRAVVRGREAAAARQPARPRSSTTGWSSRFGRRGGRQPEVRALRRRDAPGHAHLEHVDRHRHAVGPRGPLRVSEDLTHVPEGPVPASQGGARLLDLIRMQARLRAPGGCPWDAEQTHRTLARHLLEETHELLEAIDADDSDAIRDELGELLLQVTFHAQIAADDSRWDVDDVAQGLVEKLDPSSPARVR